MLNDTVVFIPARGGSKRIPRKNIFLLNGVPLINYTIQFSLKLGFPVYVSTEDSEIAEISKSCGANVIDRPKEYSQDNSLDLDWVCHAIPVLGYIPKKILLLRPTTPLRIPFIVNMAINAFSDEYDSLRSVEQLSESMEKMVRIKDGILVSVCEDQESSIMPNQFFETTYRPNGYVDIIRPINPAKYNNIYGKKCQPFDTDRTVEIDTKEDIDYAEFLLKKYSYI